MSDRTADALSAAAFVVVAVIGAIVANWLVRRAINASLGRVIDKAQSSVSGKVDASVEQSRSADRPEIEEMYRLAANELRASGERRVQRLQTLSRLSQSLATTGIVVAATILVLSQFDIDFGPFLAGAGILGIAIGFGAQSLVRDYLNGALILIENHFDVNDTIVIGEIIGRVEAITVRTTKIRDREGVEWTVPNGDIRTVANRSQTWAKIVLDVPVAYATDIGRSIRVIAEALEPFWLSPPDDIILLEAPKVLGVQELGENGVVIRVSIAAHPDSLWTGARHARRLIKDAFDAEGITIPFPQRRIWLEAQPPSVRRTVDE